MNALSQVFPRSITYNIEQCVFDDYSEEKSIIITELKQKMQHYRFFLDMYGSIDRIKKHKYRRNPINMSQYMLNNTEQMIYHFFGDRYKTFKTICKERKKL